MANSEIGKFGEEDDVYEMSIKYSGKSIQQTFGYLLLEFCRDILAVDKYFGAIVLVVMVQATRRKEVVQEEG